MVRYKAPNDMAFTLATKDGSLRKLLHGSIRMFCNDHPEWAILGEARESLAKRLDGQIRSNFAHLISDRIMLNWLE